MAVLPQDQRGQILLMLTVAAAVAGWVFWQGNPIPPKVMGWAEMGDSTREMTVLADSIEERVNRVKRDMRLGQVADLDARLAQYRSSLEMTRQLVPTTSEVADLLDDVSTRTRVRGTTIREFNMQAPESSMPFDKKRGRIRLSGTYDQIAETLSDIASLSRIVAPYDLTLQPITGMGADSLQMQGQLDATFMILTYIRTVPGGAPAAAQPAAAEAPAAAPAPRTSGAASPGASRE